MAGKAMGVVVAGMAVWLAGCGGKDGDAVFGGRPPACDAVASADGPGAGSLAAHGQPQRSDGAVRIGQRDGKVVASRTVAIVNDFGGATQAQVTLSSQNGSVYGCTRAGGGYRLSVQLEGRGATEAEARAALESMSVTHSDSLAATSLQLATRVEFATTTPSPLGSSGSSPERSASIIAGLPASASYAITPATTNGEVRVNGLSGTSARLSATNGNAALDGRWDSADVNTSNGTVGVRGDYAALTAATTNGVLETDLQTQRSLKATLSSTNGLIDAGLQRSGAGFDVQADATNGEASISVDGTEAVGTQTKSSAHRRTPDYASRSVQVQVQASTTNGGARIHQ